MNFGHLSRAAQIFFPQLIAVECKANKLRPAARCTATSARNAGGDERVFIVMRAAWRNHVDAVVLALFEAEFFPPRAPRFLGVWLLAMATPVEIWARMSFSERAAGDFATVGAAVTTLAGALLRAAAAGTGVGTGVGRAAAVVFAAGVGCAAGAAACTSLGVAAATKAWVAAPA